MTDDAMPSRGPFGGPFWGPDFSALESEGPEIASVVLDELGRLRGCLQLIASENLTSPAVLAALGSTLSNTYAEGYPGRRYYRGCAQVDRAEELAIARAKEPFGAEHANVQPHSGVSANLASYAAFTVPGDTVLAMSLPHGGHLTHGSKVNFSGTWFDIVAYGVDQETELIDYDAVRDIAVERRPKLVICGATAYPRLIDFATFRQIANEGGRDPHGRCGAFHRAGRRQGHPQPSALRRRGHVYDTQGAARAPRGDDRIEGGAREEDRQGGVPVQPGLMHSIAANAVAPREAIQPEFQAYARQVIANCQALADSLAAEGVRPVSGGTDTNLSLVDLRPIGVTGAEAETRCGAARITLNKNVIPFDPQPPMTASGIRVGTPSVTTQGMREGDMKEVASMIARAERDADGSAAAEVGAAVSALVAKHPAYPRG
jgi:glycine hydroxymethyltransferase